MNLGLLSKYRSSLMGFATILIIVCHAPANGVVLPPVLTKLLQFGGIGVDVFLFVSGFGMYYSLRNLGSKKIWEWYRHRYLRVLVPYLLFSIPVFATPYLFSGGGYFGVDNYSLLLEYISKVSTLSYWTHGWGLWFVAMLIPLYLITPIIFRMQGSFYGKICLIIIIVLIIGSQSCIKPDNQILQNAHSCLIRVPGYIIGMSMGPMIKQSKRIPLIIMISPFCLFLSCVFLHRLTGLYFGNQFMLAIPMSVIFVKIMDLVRWDAIVKIFDFFGRISLESYCTNVFCVSWFFFISKNSVLYFNNIPNYLLATIICVVISYGINYASTKVIRLLS